jgi:beta-glucanase (GH16 family)
MEYVGKEPMTTYGAIHGPGYSGADNIGGDHVSDTPVADDFHVFAIEWTPDQIHWFVDDVNFFSATPDAIPGGTEWVYNHPFFLLLNVAVGGHWPGEPDDTTTFPQTMVVDYVRVYGAANASERYEYAFSDDVEGWQRIVVPFDALTRSANQPDGAPDDGLDLTEVWGYSFNLPDGGSGLFYLDRVGFETETP